MDTVSKAKRSEIMSKVRGKNTKPEMVVRRLLHSFGFRYRLHDKSLPGKPDICMRKHKTVIFVHGCFWHRHKNCTQATTPSSNYEFWKNKFSQNVKRDKKNEQLLNEAGWRVITVWECQCKNIENLTNSLVDLQNPIQ